MPYAIQPIPFLNELFGPAGEFQPEPVLEILRGVESVLEGLDAFNALDPDLITGPNAEAFRDLAAALPPALDRMILAALRSAVSRGVRTQITWKPGYDFELSAWESSEGSAGMLNLVIVSPHPRELVPDTLA